MILNSTAEISNMIEMLEDGDRIFVIEMIKRLMRDDVATPNDILSHHIALEEYQRGETVSHDDINWN